MKSEYIANLELTPKKTNWVTPSSNKQHYKPVKQPGIVGQYLGASAVGLILASPFVVQIFIDLSK